MVQLAMENIIEDRWGGLRKTQFGIILIPNSCKLNTGWKAG